MGSVKSTESDTSSSDSEGRTHIHPPHTRTGNLNSSSRSRFLLCPSGHLIPLSKVPPGLVAKEKATRASFSPKDRAGWDQLQKLIEQENLQNRNKGPHLFGSTRSERDHPWKEAAGGNPETEDLRRSMKGVDSPLCLRHRHQAERRGGYDHSGGEQSKCSRKGCVASYSGSLRFQKLRSHSKLHFEPDAFRCPLCDHIVPSRTSLAKHLDYNHQHRGLPNSYLEAHKINRSTPVTESAAASHKAAIKNFLKVEIAAKERELKDTLAELKVRAGLKEIRDRLNNESARRAKLRELNPKVTADEVKKIDDDHKKRLTLQEEVDIDHKKRSTLHESLKEVSHQQAEQSKREFLFRKWRINLLEREKQKELEKELEKKKKETEKETDQAVAEGPLKRIYPYLSNVEESRENLPAVQPSAPVIPAEQLQPEHFSWNHIVWSKAAEEEAEYLAKAKQHFWAHLFRLSAPKPTHNLDTGE